MRTTEGDPWPTSVSGASGTTMYPLGSQVRCRPVPAGREATSPAIGVSFGATPFRFGDRRSRFGDRRSRFGDRRAAPAFKPGQPGARFRTLNAHAPQPPLPSGERGADLPVTSSFHDGSTSPSLCLPLSPEGRGGRGVRAPAARIIEPKRTPKTAVQPGNCTQLG